MVAVRHEVVYGQVGVREAGGAVGGGVWEGEGGGPGVGDEWEYEGEV